MLTPRFHTVLFDLDGTVLDTISMITDSLRLSLDTHLQWTPPLAVLTRGVGMRLAEQLTGHANDAHRAQGGPAPTPALIDALEATYIEHNRAIHDARVRAFPRANDLFEALTARGVNLAIVTSKPHAIAARGLAVCGLTHHFGVLIGADDVQQHKPDPEPVHTALTRLGADVAGTLFVGDSPYDLRAGRLAGVQTGAAHWGPFPAGVLATELPDHDIETLWDVKAVVG
ncbi:MAG: pyrophosphatase PpaX [Bradymonadia bacterium]|jgi:pyrophosphatase PpaX